MKIRAVHAAGLHGATPAGGWSDELDRDDVVHTLVAVHTDEGLERSAEAFRRLIDRAIERGGSFYLTYHRWATAEQLDACYPQLRDFLRLKLEHDPREVFQSEWYRHHRSLLGV